MSRYRVHVFLFSWFLIYSIDVASLSLVIFIFRFKTFVCLMRCYSAFFGTCHLHGSFSLSVYMSYRGLRSAVLRQHIYEVCSFCAHIPSVCAFAVGTFNPFTPKMSIDIYVLLPFSWLRLILARLLSSLVFLDAGIVDICLSQAAGTIFVNFYYRTTLNVITAAFPSGLQGTTSERSSIYMYGVSLACAFSTLLYLTLCLVFVISVFLGYCYTGLSIWTLLRLFRTWLTTFLCWEIFSYISLFSYSNKWN